MNRDSIYSGPGTVMTTLRYETVNIDFNDPNLGKPQKRKYALLVSHIVFTFFHHTNLKLMYMNQY